MQPEGRRPQPRLASLASATTTIFEDCVQVRQPVFDKPVKALELLLCVRHLPLQCHQAAIEAF
jgi:hypothetical protein